MKGYDSAPQSKEELTDREWILSGELCWVTNLSTTINPHDPEQNKRVIDRLSDRYGKDAVVISIAMRMEDGQATGDTEEHSDLCGVYVDIQKWLA